MKAGILMSRLRNTKRHYELVKAPKPDLKPIVEAPSLLGVDLSTEVAAIFWEAAQLSVPNGQLGDQYFDLLINEFEFDNCEEF